MGKSILLIDDDLEDCEIFTEALSKITKDFVCTIAHNGEDALLILSKMAMPPDIVFLDLNMPGLNGMECLRAIKSKTAYANLKVVIFTASSARKYEQQLIQAGAYSVITKPGSYKLLLDILSGIIDSVPLKDKRLAIA